ncbi:MAG: hypothetical protein AAB567_00840 [Patescibacteria group bacterium]
MGSPFFNIFFFNYLPAKFSKILFGIGFGLIFFFYGAVSVFELNFSSAQETETAQESTEESSEQEQVSTPSSPTEDSQQEISTEQPQDQEDGSSRSPDPAIQEQVSGDTSDAQAEANEHSEVQLEGENEAKVVNTTEVESQTGGNTVTEDGEDAAIQSGQAQASATVVNVVNANILDSNGLFLLFSNFRGLLGDIDLRNLDLFSQGNWLEGAKCPLAGCDTIDLDAQSQSSAAVTNTMIVRSITGMNAVSNSNGGGSIQTGAAYGAANMVNIVNTNIVDSNYLFFVANNFGSLQGDMVFPAASFFSQFFSSPGDRNGTQEGLPEACQTTDNSSQTIIENHNQAQVENTIEVRAQTGANEALSAQGTSAVRTGSSFAAANTVNQVNTNLFGGSSFFALFRIAGDWAGNMFSLPPGIVWQETSDGLILYSDPSLDLQKQMCVDQSQSGFERNIENANDASLKNNIQVFALTGKNKIENDGEGIIETGNAYAVANLVNVVNTNVIGRNWILALINILGDWKGNVAFGRPDLWVGERVEVPRDPIGPGEKVMYHLTVVNNGDADATKVNLKGTFENSYLTLASIEDGASVQGDEISWDLGTILAGGSKEISFAANVNQDIPYGSTQVTSKVAVESFETDENNEDNFETVSFAVFREMPPLPPSNLESRSACVDCVFRPFTPKPDLHIVKSRTSYHLIPPGGTVDYRVVIMNESDWPAYHAVLSDALENEKGEVVHQKKWELDQIFPHEEIIVEYTTVFSKDAKAGIYINRAQVKGMGGTWNGGYEVESNIASSGINVVRPQQKEEKNEEG